MTKYVLITGGVVPFSSIGKVLEACGLRVTSIKIDPYLNTDAGTMSPFEHEVFVLDDGGEVDLDLEDLENYERFLDIEMTRGSNITTGKIYQSVIAKEGRGDYLGKTVQVVPHVTDEIKQRILSVMSSVPVDGQTRPADVCVIPIELGGIGGKDKTMASREDHLIQMAMFWDIENCKVPRNAQVEAISENIRNALIIMDPAIDLAKATFQAYGAVSALIKKGLERSGVRHADIPNRKKDAADKMIFTDMFSFALDNPPPACMLLISGDADFAPAARVLVKHGYTIVIAVPSQGSAASDLITAGTYVWDWTSLARGKGIVIRRPLPTDLKILKTEMIQLFTSHGGYIGVGHIHSEYTKMFAKQIKLSDYNAPKLVDLFIKMGEPFSVFERKMVFLNMQFDQGSTSTSGVPASVTEISFVNTEEDPYGPVEDTNVEGMLCS